MGSAIEAAQRSGWRWPAALAATLALILIVNPVGYMGGGWDDWQYLNAARCWVAHGPCLPTDHWQGRWPVVAPLAASIALLGESRFSVGLPFLLYAVGILALLVRVGNRVAGEPIGWLAALLFLATTMFALQLLDPNVEYPEAFFLLGSAALIIDYRDHGGAWRELGAGLAWSLAFQSRETAVAAVPLLAWAAWRFARHDWRALLAAVVGAALPFVVELLAFWIVTGDPLWRRNLSIAHTTIPTTELRTPVDPREKAFFNPHYIASWRLEPGIYLHWTVDALINLLFNVKAGMIIPLSLLLFACFGKRLPPAERRLIVLAYAVALGWACFLIYALAIDPKARMMFVPVALMAMAFAVQLRHQWRKVSRILAIVCVSLSLLTCMTLMAAHPEIRTSEDAARRWATRYPGKIEMEVDTAKHLALAHVSDVAPTLGADRSMLMIRVKMSCTTWNRRFMGNQLDLIDQSDLSLMTKFTSGRGGSLCLFRYRRPIAEPVILDAKTKTALDDPTPAIP